MFFKAAEYVVRLEDGTVDVKAIRFQGLDIFLEPEDAEVETLLEIFMALHHLLEEVSCQLFVGVPEDDRTDELLLICLAIFDEGDE